LMQLADAWMEHGPADEHPLTAETGQGSGN
jgi:hypothetical protein